ncbi:MAG: glycosyltransferase [Rhodothermaceae bacterium]|nr:glycosyltransferase [Rhodothermaceae bacterium]
MSKPKVLLLGKLPPPYMGPAIATEIILNSALTKQYNVIHLDTNVHKTLGTLGTLSLKKVGQNVGIYFRFLSILLREKPDVVLIPISQATIGFFKDAVFILLASMLKSRVLIQLRGSNIKNWLAKASWFTRTFASLSLRKANGAIVLGEKLKHLFTDYLPTENIYVVPNGANYPGLQVQKRRAPAALRVLYLANLMPSKGIEDAILAIKELKDRKVQHVTLDVVGNWLDDDIRRTCLHLVRLHNLPVRFHGPAIGKKKFRFFSEADLFVFVPRLPEGHPWVIVESLAVGLPIISTDQGAISESVIDGVNGFIVQEYSPRQIADKIMLFMKDQKLIEQFSAASRAHYLNNFTEEKMVQRLSHAIDMVLPASLKQVA